MGVLAPGSAHARPCAQPPIDMIDVVCENPLTCWLCLNKLNFQTMWCVKSCWQADFASTELIYEPCGVWKASDLLTLIKLTKFQTHVVCETLLTCWLWIKSLNFPTMWCVHLGIFSNYPLNPNSIYVWKAADMLTLLQQTKKLNLVVFEKPLTCWLFFEETKFINHMVCEKLLTCWLGFN